MHIFLSTVFFVVFSFYLYWTLRDTMGETDSHLLNIILAHFKEIGARAHDLSVYVKKEKMTTYYTSEWPTFDVRRGPSISPWY